jgi:gamma-glutamyltranspeptidase/glutathione hydrolase/leukotriene-C4 hydrolase
MIFPYQAFLTHSGFGLHHVCLFVACSPRIVFTYADNYPEAQKRPLSSIAPTIIENSDGSFYLALGGAGGSKILSAVFQVILNLDWGLDISSAIEYGRLHHQLYPEWIDADDTYPYELFLGLKERGHALHGA